MMMMEWMRWLMMGGWLPEGKRSQWLAAAAAFGTVLVAVAQWGSGTMDAMTLVTLLTDKWPVFVAAWGLNFMADKVDRSK